MKIAIDIRSLMELRHSGVEEYTTQIIKAMVKIAPQNQYFIFYNASRRVNIAPFDGTISEVFRYPNKFLNLAQYLAGRPKWDKMLRPRTGLVDVFFVPNARLLPLQNKIPVVVTVHDLSFARFPEFYSIKRRLWHQLIKPRKLLTEASHIIAVSTATKEDIVALYGIEAEKVSVIYSGLAKFVSDFSQPSRIANNLKLPAKFILYLGVLEPRKNIISVIEAYSAIARRIPHSLVLAGESGWLEKGIIEAIENSPVKNRIHRIGLVSEEAKWQIYSKADLFVYPSFYEGFGFPPLEALLAGTPVITSHNSSLPEIVGEWANMINPYDVAELALVMEELLKKPERIPDNIRQQIKSKYSWETAAQQTLDVFSKVT